MGHVKKAKLVKLFFALLGQPEFIERGREMLAERFGPEEIVGPIWDFQNTDYYQQEMGGGLKRQFIVPVGMIDPGELAKTKIMTNGLEDELAQASRRRLNIDPGYLNDNKVVLATTKDYAHRLYLGQGIYAELTLMFRRGAYQPLDHTYPDYRSEEYGGFFSKMRRAFFVARENAPRR